MAAVGDLAATSCSHSPHQQPLYFSLETTLHFHTEEKVPVPSRCLLWPGKWHLCVRVSVSVVCACIFMHACMHACMLYSLMEHNPTNLIHFFLLIAGKSFSSRIGILVVVENRAVIKIQSYVRLVVGEGIIPGGLAPRKVFGQKQSHATPKHYLACFKIASCKNSVTSCLEQKS